MAGNSVRRLCLFSAAMLAGGAACVAAQSVAVGTVAEGVSNRRTVTIHADSVALKAVLQQIALQAGLAPFYGSAVNDSKVRVTLHVDKVPAADAFERALRSTGLRASIDARVVAFEAAGGATISVVQGSVTGKITDAKTQQPLRGATVTLDGSAKGIVTGDNGTFRFPTVAPGNHTISVRLLGYVRATKTVTVTEGQAAAADFALAQSVSALDQVVVTGTVIPVAQRELPVPITIITAKQIQESGVTTVSGLLQGQVPGVIAIDYGMGSEQNNNGVPITVRGDATLGFEYNNRIKIYIDGVEMSDPGQINSVDPAMIERIEILRGPQASTIYGSGSISGVMQIFTKRGSRESQRPQAQLQLSFGTIENNLNSGITPRQDHSLNVSSNNGAFTANVGGSYKYTGQFVKDFYIDNKSLFGGVRTQQGPVTVDASLRFNWRRVGVGVVPSVVQAENDGTIRYSSFDQVRPAQDIVTNQRTYSGSVEYAPTKIWQSTLRIGRDESDAGFVSDGGRYRAPSDSLLSINQNPSTLSQVNANTTLAVPISTNMRATLTAGYDHWSSSYNSVFAQSPVLTGSLAGGVTLISRSLSRNDGYFAQTMIGLFDQLFLTAGLRAEDNPNFGPDVRFAYSPRYGIAWTHDLGLVTMKLRSGYGRSTRPPSEDEKQFVINNPQSVQLANPNVGPESQHGTDGGVELYFGNRGSLNVTYYNQYVTDVLRSVVVAVDTGTTFRQFQNVGDVHNSGAELEGTINTGPLSTRLTYSIVNSKIGRLIPEAAGLGLVAGQRLTGVAPHTGAVALTYSYGPTRVNVDVTYVAVMLSQGERGYTLARFNRLFPKPDAQYSMYITRRPSETRTNLSITHTLMPHAELFVRGDNIGNQNNNASEFPVYPSVGRQWTLGARLY